MMPDAPGGRGPDARAAKRPGDRIQAAGPPDLQQRSEPAAREARPLEEIDLFSSILKRYKVARLVGDRFGSQFVQEPFRVRGVSYDVSDAPKSDLYRDALPMINSGLAGLLDHPKTLTQFCQLDRRVSRAGHDSIDHPPGPFHDDLCNVVAGLLVTCGTARLPLRVPHAAILRGLTLPPRVFRGYD
jgi:hypothetical protein